MYKSCSRCGKIHNYNYKCNVGKERYNNRNKTEADNLRNTHGWHTKAEQIKEDSNYLCSVCRDEGIYTYNNLEVHHITKIKEDKDKLLDNYNLICLCVRHHKLADKNMIEKEYLFKLAKEREEGHHEQGRK